MITLKTSMGDIVLELDEEKAPKTVANFKQYVEDGHYDGTVFHRVIANFMVQTGCPHTKEGESGVPGTGGPGYHIDAEFNDVEHTRGVVSMARAADPNSAGSQFFICLEREHCQHLDGQYTAFGQVVEGMDVVKKFGQVETGAGDKPVETVTLIGVKQLQTG